MAARFDPGRSHIGTYLKEYGRLERMAEDRTLNIAILKEASSGNF